MIIGYTPPQVIVHVVIVPIDLGNEHELMEHIDWQAGHQGRICLIAAAIFCGG